MVSKTEHDQGHSCSWDVPNKLQEKYWARVELDSVLLIDTFFVLFRSSGVDTQG